MAEVSEEKSSIRIGVGSFITAVSILLALIIFSGVLTQVIPSGAYDRVQMDGRQMVVEDSYHQIEKGNYPAWRWFTAPVEVIWGDNWMMVMVLILFMWFIGGSFTVMEKGQIVESVLAILVDKFGNRKYLLMAVVMFAMMFMASVIGIFEAMVPTVIFLVPLALALGWDSLVGLGMTLLALAFGFAAAVTNPFTIGVAQGLADLPLFSGAWLRILFFITVYGLSYLYVSRYARKIEKNPEKSIVFEEDNRIRHRYSHESVLAHLPMAREERMQKAIRWVATFLILALGFLFVSALVPSIPTDYAFPFVALMFMVAGIGAGIRSGMGTGQVWKVFGKGALNMLPGILLILMAMSVPHIMTRGGVMDTILYRATLIIEGTGLFKAAFLVFLLTLILNFFISSASAKAFLMMPILVPLADLVQLTRQTVVLAFDMGDGFSNMFFPTNALLLVGLGFTVVSYPKWIRWTWKIQLMLLALSLLFMGIAVKIGFGPF